MAWLSVNYYYNYMMFLSKLSIFKSLFSYGTYLFAIWPVSNIYWGSSASQSKGNTYRDNEQAVLFMLLSDDFLTLFIEFLECSFYLFPVTFWVVYFNAISIFINYLSVYLPSEIISFSNIFSSVVRVISLCVSLRLLNWFMSL